MGGNYKYKGLLADSKSAVSLESYINDVIGDSKVKQIRGLTINVEINSTNLDRFNGMRYLVVKFKHAEFKFTPQIANNMIITGTEFLYFKTIRTINNYCLSNLEIYGLDMNEEKMDIIIEPGDEMAFEFTFHTHMDIKCRLAIN